jgi:hypothetical protein
MLTALFLQEPTPAVDGGLMYRLRMTQSTQDANLYMKDIKFLCSYAETTHSNEARITRHISVMKADNISVFVPLTDTVKYKVRNKTSIVNVKLNFFSVLTNHPKGVQKELTHSSMHFKLQTKWRWAVSVTLKQIYPREKCLLCQAENRPGRLEIRSRHGNEDNLLHNSCYRIVTVKKNGFRDFDRFTRGVDVAW